MAGERSWIPDDKGARIALANEPPRVSLSARCSFRGAFEGAVVCRFPLRDSVPQLTYLSVFHSSSRSRMSFRVDHPAVGHHSSSKLETASELSEQCSVSEPYDLKEELPMMN